MTRVFGMALALLFTATSAFADVTVKYVTTGKGMMGMGGNFESSTSIKGNKMRTEATVGGEATITVLDLDTQQMISINPKKKEAEILDLNKFNADLEKTVGAAEAKVSVKANGQQKEILGRSCTGYTVSIAMPMSMGEGMQMTMVMTGPMWLAPGVPGSDDFSAFYRAAAQKGFFFTNPQQAKAQPAQAKGMAEMYKAVAELRGIVYEQEINIKIEGEGPMAAMMAKMGGSAMTMTVTSVATEALSADLFAVPAGYKTKTK